MPETHYGFLTYPTSVRSVDCARTQKMNVLQLCTWMRASYITQLSSFISSFYLIHIQNNEGKYDRAFTLKYLTLRPVDNLLLKTSDLMRLRRTQKQLVLAPLSSSWVRYCLEKIRCVSYRTPNFFDKLTSYFISGCCVSSCAVFWTKWKSFCFQAVKL